MLAISLYTGIYHLIIFFKSRDEPYNISFSLLCFALSGYDLFCMGLYNSKSVSESIFWQKGQFFSISVISVSLIFFYHKYTNTRIKWPVNIFLILPQPIITFIILFTNLGLNADNPSIKEVLFNIVYFEAQPQFIINLLYLILLIGMLYSFIILYRYFKYKNSNALIIVISTLCFFITATNDILVGSGLIRFIYLAEYGFSFILAGMSYTLLNESLQAKLKAQNLVSALSSLNERLEIKVEKRTNKLMVKDKEFKNQLRMARQIQTELLPNLDYYNKIMNISYEYRPMMEVSGDFIDVLHMQRENKLGLFICDVSGHGIAAALFTVMVKISLQSIVKNTTSPAEILTNLSNSLAGKMGNNFITALFVTIDKNDGLMTVARAGHEPVLVVSQKGEYRVIEPPGKLIFELSGSQFEEETIQLSKKDMVIFFTDGVSEARNDKNEFFELKSLIRLITDHRSAGPKKIGKVIIENIYNFIGTSEITDDITVMVYEH